MPTLTTSLAPEDRLEAVSDDHEALVVPASKDWLPNMIFAMKKMASGTQYLSLPYVQTALGAVVLLLETVEKVMKNRDDLRDLCSSVVEIILVIRGEVLAHESTINNRFVVLCEDFIEVVKVLRHGLDKLQKSRQGIHGRFKEMIGATRIADEIGRYRTRMNDLRSNFMLVATLDTNFNVADVHNRLGAIPIIQNATMPAQYRQLIMGDVNLLYESAMENKVRRIKIFTARIAGEAFPMTVATYEEEPEWQKDLALYSGRRPRSDLVWACIEGMLVSTIRVRKEPIQLCLTMPDEEWSYSVDQFTEMLSAWYSGLYKFQPSTSVVAPIVSNCSYPRLHKTFTQEFGWTEFYGTLIAPWKGGPFVPMHAQGQYPLGVMVEDSNHGDGQRPRIPFRPLTLIPHSFDVQFKDWSIGSQSKFAITEPYNATWAKFTFPPHSFKVGLNPRQQSIMAFMKLDNAGVSILHHAWLSQGNMFVRGGQKDSGFQWGTIPSCFGYRKINFDFLGIVDMITCHLRLDQAFENLLHTDGMTMECHLFVCPLTIRGRCIPALPESDYYYWATDPVGEKRLSQQESDNLGLPRFILEFRHWATFWQPYHYSAVRDFHRGKGFNPYSLDVTNLLGLPVIEM
ncbi:hypothetical protein K438DRAFT_2165090 [Mycena galopus ATCC 62051]|nr:hypothetical protein K438DRAFT_2165090 [Mycena galopus ATCC 62051]